MGLEGAGAQLKEEAFISIFDLIVFGHCGEANRQTPLKPMAFKPAGHRENQAGHCGQDKPGNVQVEALPADGPGRAAVQLVGTGGAQASQEVHLAGL